jgi:hypothetical protein
VLWGCALRVAVVQDLDQCPEEPKARFANEGKYRSINLILFKIYATIYVMFVHLSSKS